MLILYLYGFRITYDSQLENDWGAIGAMGQWASAVIGIFVPVAIVFIQKKLENNKKEIGDSNLLLYEEINKIKEKLNQVELPSEDNEEIKRNKIKLKAQKIIDIGLFVNTKAVSEQIGLSTDETYELLEEMYRHDRSIGAAGQVRKERIDSIIWIPKNKN